MLCFNLSALGALSRIFFFENKFLTIYADPFVSRLLLCNIAHRQNCPFKFGKIHEKGRQ